MTPIYFRVRFLNIESFYLDLFFVVFFFITKGAGVVSICVNYKFRNVFHIQMTLTSDI